MDAHAALAILLAIALHVTWNLLARHVPGRQEFIWWALAGHLVLLGPLTLPALALEGRWSSPLSGCIALSGAALTVYFLSLRFAYRYAPVALAYPLARSSPLFIALLGWLFMGQALNAGVISGIVISSGALILLASTAWRGSARPALLPALLAAGGTTVYSLSDKMAVGLLPGLAAQIGYITLGYLSAWLGLCVALRRETGHWRPRFRPPMPLLLAGALSIGLSYALIVHAMGTLPAAVAVALSNGGIVVATLLSLFWFGEREHRWARLAWSCLLALGLALVALSA
jgi:drug/metabolite transporter (DMT)-like permease